MKNLLIFLSLSVILASPCLADSPPVQTQRSTAAIDTSNFDSNLSAADDTLQKALETLDEVAGVGDSVETNQDDAWKAVSDGTGTQTLITVTYQDATNDVDFVVENDLNLYDWTNVDGTDLKTGSVTQAYDAFLQDIADLTDPGADRLPFWDDSGSAIVWLSLGTGLSITDTTISATGTTTLDGMTDTDLTGPAEHDILAWNTTDWVDLSIGGDLTGAINGSAFDLTIAANSVALATDTTGNYVATLADAGNGFFTIANSGSENAAVTIEIADKDWGDFSTSSQSATLDAGVVAGAELAAVLTFSDGDQIDLTAITYVNAATTNEGIALPTYVAGSAPADNKPYMAYDASNNRIMVYEVGGWADTSSGSGASADSYFVTYTADGGLSDDRVVTAGYGMDITNAGTDGGALTFLIDTTEISADGSDTWSDGSNAAIVWTFDVSGTDTTATFGNGIITLSQITSSSADINGGAIDGTTIGAATPAAGTFAALTATGVLTTGSGSHTLTNAAGLFDGEKVQDDTIDDDSIDFTDVTLADLTFDVGSVDTTEFGYLDGVTSAVQTQLDARALESVIGDAIEADDLELNGTTLQLVAEIPHSDAAINISGQWEWQNETSQMFGDDASGASGNFMGLRWDTDLSGYDDDFDAAHALSGEGLAIYGNNSSNDLTVVIDNLDGTYEATLYVANIVTKSIIYGGADADERYISLANVSHTPAAGGWEIFFEGNELVSAENATKKVILNELDAFSVDGTWDIGGAWDMADGTLEIPNGADPTTDAFGELAADNNAWASSYGAVEFYNGTESTFLVGIDVSDAASCTDGQIPKMNAAGNWTCEDDDDSGGAPDLENVGNPGANWTPDMTTYTITMDFGSTAADMFNIQGTGVLTSGYSLALFEQTVDSTGGHILKLRTVDTEADVNNLIMSNGNDDYETTQILEAGTIERTGVSDGHVRWLWTTEDETQAAITTGTFEFIADSDGTGMSANQDVLNVRQGTTILMSIDFEGDFFALATISGTDLLASDDIIGQDDLQLDSDAALIQMGENQDVTFTHVADTGVLLTGTTDNQLQIGDSGTFLNQSTDGTLNIAGDTLVEITTPNLRLEVDDAAYLNIATADGGATTISQVSDGTDQITIGDGGDRIDIASDSWDVTNGAVSGVTTLAMSGAFSPEGAINLGTGGVIFTDDGDGMLTITGAGDGSDENLTINLDDTPNTAVIGSGTGVTEINTGAIGIATTGSLTGLNKQGADITGAVSHDTTDLHGVMYKFTAAATVTLDAAADAGYGACASYRVRDAAEAAVLDVQAGEKFNLAGTALAAGTAITATGAGEYVTVCATTDTDGSGTDGYDVYGESSGWASE